MSSLVDQFARATQLAIHLQNAGRPGLLSDEDFRELVHFGNAAWNIYTNSMGTTKVFSPDGDSIVLNREQTSMSVHGPQKESF